ncbi:UNVERIFIED_CONTAM: hypothetical protein FKN15_031445 [Acipenser sinensis]
MGGLLATPTSITRGAEATSTTHVGSPSLEDVFASPPGDAFASPIGDACLAPPKDACLAIAWGCLLLRIAWGCLLLRIAWGAISYRVRGRSRAPAAAFMARGSPTEYTSRGFGAVAAVAVSLLESMWLEPWKRELSAMKNGGQETTPQAAVRLPGLPWLEESACVRSAWPLQLLMWEEDCPP